MPDVADYAYPHAVQISPCLPQRVAVEQGLGGVFMAAVSGVDDRGVCPAGQPVGGAGHGVADDYGVGAVGADDLDGVAQALALAERRGAGREGHGVGREAPGGGLEREAGTGRVLEEQRRHRAASQGRHFGDGPASDLGERVGEVQDLLEVVTRHAVDAEQVSARNGPG